MIDTEKATVATSYGASAVTVFAGMTINEWVAVVGIALGVATFAVNAYYKHKHFLLDQKKTDYLEHVHSKAITTSTEDKRQAPDQRHKR